MTDPLGLAPTEPFSRLGLTEELLLMQELMAELSHVDRVLSLHYIDDTGPLFGHWEHPTVDYVEIGETYPFTRSRDGIWQGIWPGRVESDLATATEDAKAWASTNVQSLYYVMDPIIHPRVEIYDGIDESLGEILNRLSKSVSENFNDLEYRLGDWRGEAATEFRAGFYTAFSERVQPNQKHLLERFRAEMRLSKAITRIAQHSLMTLVVNVKAAVDEQLRMRSESTSTPSVRNILILAAAVAALVSVVPSGGASVASSATVASVALGYAATSIPEDVADTYTIEGASAEELFNSLYDGVRQIGCNMRAQYEGLEARLQEMSGEFSRDGVYGELTPIRPAIADGDFDDFYHKTGSRRSEGR